jgi:PAS domain S-box-containing protein
MLNNRRKIRKESSEEKRVRRSRVTKLEPVEIRKSGQTDSMSIEDVLRASDEKYRPLFDNMLNGFAYCRILLDEYKRPTDFIYIDVNTAFEKLTGLKKEEVIGRRMTEAIPGIREAHSDLFDIYGEVALTGKETKFEIYFEPLGIWLSISAYSPGAGYFVTMFENISEQKKAEEEREVMIKLLSLINSSNHMHEMMRLVTVFLRDWSQCEAVGIRLAEEEDYPYFVTSGFPEEFVLAENSLCSVDETGKSVRDSQGRVFLECMCGNVISGRYDPSKPFFTRNGSFWTNSTTDLLAGTTEADRLAKTRNRCNTAGYESVALVPLRAGGKTFGLLQFNDKHRGRFTPGRISLFERLADNLAIGLAQRRAEQSLRSSEMRLSEAVQIAKLGYWEYDVAKNLFTFNDQFYSVYRTSVEQVGGYKISPERYAELFLFPEDVPNLHNEIRTIIEATDPNFSNYAEHRVKFGNGETGYVSIRHFVIKDSHGRTIKTHGVNQDITERKRAEEALKKAENEKATILNTMSELVAYQDAEHRIIWANKAAVESAGSTTEELLGRYCYEIWQGRNKPCVNCPVEKAWKTGRLETEEIYSPDGRTWSVRANPVKNKTDDVIGVVEITLDITERKRAEEALRASEARYRSYINVTSDIAWVTDADGKVAEDIPSWRKFTGQTYEEAKGSGWASALHPDDVERTLAAWRHVVSTKSDYAVEYRMRRYDGEYRHLLARGVPVMDEDGNILEWVGTCTDITERKQAEEALQESEIRFRELFETMSNGVAVYEAINDGEDFVFKNMNRSGERIDKIRRAEVIGKKVAEVFPGIKKFGLFKVFQRVWRTGQPEHHPVSLYKDERLTHWVENYVYKLPTGEIVAVYDDVTKRKQAEEKLYEYQNQLKYLASQVSKVQEQERRNIAVEMHDRVSQRLAMAKVNLQIATKSSTDTKVSEKLSKTAEEISRVIEDTYSLMVELSNPVLYEIGLRAAVESLLKKRIGPEQNMDYVLEADNDDFKMDNAVRIPLYQAVRELLRNVMKHSKANKVVVSIRKTGDNVQVVVRDNGVGFETSKMGKSKDIKAGGFGLFSTKENIEYINGKLEIKSEPGRGTVATITVPLGYKATADSGGK